MKNLMSHKNLKYRILFSHNYCHLSYYIDEYFFSKCAGLDDPFLVNGIENDDFGDAYTLNIKDL